MKTNPNLVRTSFLLNVEVVSNSHLLSFPNIYLVSLSSFFFLKEPMFSHLFCIAVLLNAGGHIDGNFSFSRHPKNTTIWELSHRSTTYKSNKPLYEGNKPFKGSDHQSS